MFKKIFTLTFMLFVCGCFKDKKSSLTSEALYEGLTVPVQRNFNLSSKIGACEDFHKYVCSETEDNFKLPSDRERWTFSFTDNGEKLLHAKKNFFLKINDYKPKSKRAQQFKDVYLACMNEESAKKEEIDFISAETKTLSTLKNNADLINLSESRLDQGLKSFTNLYTTANKEDPSIFDAVIISDMQSLPERSYYQNKDLIKEFKNILTEFFKTVKMDQPEVRSQWVIDFETSLAMKAPLPHEMRGRSAEKRDITRADFLKRYPELKFDRMLSKIPEKTVLIDLIPETNEFVNQAFTTQSLEALKSVYAFHSMEDYLDAAYPEFFNKYFKFKNKYLGGPELRPALQERCTTLVMNQFGMELDYELIDILFPKFPEDRAIKMGEAVRASILKGLNNNTWLSESTKQEAINKIKFAKLHLVQPKKDKDWNFMTIQKYDPSKPYANYILYSKTDFAKTLQELKDIRNPDLWYMSPLVVNAYYSANDNKFVLPQGILQFPFFSSDMTDAENIAAIGMVVGHELGHGVDDKGSKYDYTGKVRDWFTKSDLENFKLRGDRFIAQFNKIGHDGKLTLGENIGDHVGLTFSYNAAFSEPEKASIEDKQKFFVAFARMWCGVRTDSQKQILLKTDPHSLGEERINQQVIHIPGFHEAFSCKPGDKMFLAEKDRIRIW